MNYIICEKLNPVHEAYLLLHDIINEEDPALQQDNLLKYHTPAADKMANLLEEQINVYNTIKEQLSDNLERLTFFFKNGENPDTSLASILFTSTLDSSFEAVAKSLNCFSDKERFELLRNCVLGALYGNSTDCAPDCTTIQNERDLFNCIEDESGLSYEHKYYLILLYHHFDKLLEELHHILLKTAVLLEPFLDRMQAVITPFAEELKENLSESGLAFFEQEFCITLASSNLKIYPTFVGFNKLILENFLGEGPYDHLFLGVYIVKLIRLKHITLMDDKNLPPFLKAIADPSKLEILKFLRTEKLYASQLAEKLHISNATISHHVSTLLSLELITFEREQTKIYFSLNKDKMKSYLTLLQRVFE